MIRKITSYLFFSFLICLFGLSNVLAASFDDFEVTWYYRNKGNESQLLNVLKQEDVPLYASTSEYVNGYTTRVEQTFTKQIQYIVNYQLQMWFSPEQELNYRSDTLQRIIDYSYVDSDFKILNTVATENWNRSTSGTGNTILTINVSMQVLALDNTDAIRFGVYTINNISIGFYNHTDQVDYYLVDNINIEENANASIIDQNNQILNGQNSLNQSIINSQNSINQNIIDSNQETQNVIKDQFNDCRDSYNLFNGTFSNIAFWSTLEGTTTTIASGSNYLSSVVLDVVSGKSYSVSRNLITPRFTIGFSNSISPGSEVLIYKSSNSTSIQNIVVPNGYNTMIIYLSNTSIDTSDLQIMVNEGPVSKSYEPYGEEICQNRIDETNDKIDQTNKELGDLNNNITDDNIDDNNVSNAFNQFESFIEDNSTISSLITLPVTLFSAILNGLQNSCVPFNLGSLYGEDLILPCINLSSYLGSTLWTMIDIIISGFAIYFISQKFIKVFNTFSSMKEGDVIDD